MSSKTKTLKLKITQPILVIAFLILVISCKSYTIPINSFKEQLIEANSSTIKDATINNPLLSGTITYATNNLEGIIVINKSGARTYLKNSPSLEMRVTHKNNKKYHMYFDTVIMEDGLLKGARSRFIQGLNRQIPIDSILKIEVQEGSKKFKYQN